MANTGVASRLGRTEPRIFTPPLRELTPDTSMGFDVIEFAHTVLGLQLMPWQKWLLVHMLEISESTGWLRFRTVLVIVARQNGKTWLSVVIGLFFQYILQLRLIIGTAQRLDLAEETWQSAVDLVTEEDPETGTLVRPELANRVEKVVKVNGKKAFILKGDRRWEVRAANRGAGRGRTAGLVFLDELREHRSWEAWAALSKTVLAVANALVLAITNAGDSLSVVLRHLRRTTHLALGDPDGAYSDSTVDEIAEDLGEEFGEESDIGIFEWSAPPAADRWDRDAWTYANPAMGHRAEGMSERTIASAARTDPPWVFQTEVLCQWPATSRDSVFPPGAWESSIDPESSIPPGNRVIFSLAVSYDRAYTTLAATGRRADGLTHSEIIARRAGTGWVREWITGVGPDGTPRCDAEHPMILVGQTSNAPVASVMEGLTDIEGLQIVPWKGADLGIGHSLFFDMVTTTTTTAEGKDVPASTLKHLPQPVVDVPAATASARPLAEGVWVWSLKSDGDDTAPLMAMTGGVWGLHLGCPEPPASAYDSHDLAFV